VLTDNDGVWSIAKDATGTTSLIYIIRHVRFVQQAQEHGEIKVEQLDGRINPTDGLTKCVYEIYCRMSLQSAIGVGRAITSASVDTTAMRFRTEELELTRAEVVEAYGGQAALERDEIDAAMGQD
jgi:hypothetical protein